MPNEDGLRPPALLRELGSWQINKIATIGARLNAQRLPPGSRADFAVLASLQEYGPLSQAELGRRLGLDRNEVNGVVNRLEQNAFVDRHTDPADRRRNIVTVTEAGRLHLGVLQEHAEQVQEALLHALGEQERSQLQALLAKVLESHGTQPA